MNDEVETLGQALECEQWDIRIAELAKLHPIEYDRIRETEAEALSCQKTTLDSLVRAARKGEGRLQGKPIEFPEVKPAGEPVDGKELLDALAAIYRRYIILPAHADTLLALWTIHTYAIDAANISPYVATVSPTPECGKTTCLRVMHAIAWRAVLASNISSSALYRVICEHHPTLLIDEMDSFADEKSELRNVLNGGHTRGAHVIRSVGDDHDPRQFDTYGAKSLAAIGKLSPTLSSRSIQVRLRRKKASEKVDKLPLEGPPNAKTLSRQCLRWVNDNRRELRAQDPFIPPGLNNRNADNWSVLFAIAELAGWTEKAHKAAEALSSQYEEDVAGILLLADAKTVFGDDDRIHSETFVDRLLAIEDGPWSDWSRGKAITANRVAKLLAQFDIRPKQLRIGPRNRNGYAREAFEDAWARYLSRPPKVGPTSPTTLQPALSEAPENAICRVVEVVDPEIGDESASNWTAEEIAEAETERAAIQSDE